MAFLWTFYVFGYDSNPRINSRKSWMNPMPFFFFLKKFKKIQHVCRCSDLVVTVIVADLSPGGSGAWQLHGRRCLYSRHGWWKYHRAKAGNHLSGWPPTSTQVIFLSFFLMQWNPSDVCVCEVGESESVCACVRVGWRLIVIVFFLVLCYVIIAKHFVL